VVSLASRSVESGNPGFRVKGETMDVRTVRMVVVVMGLSLTSAAAAETTIAGAWTLVSYAREDPASGVSTFPFGQKPAGTLLLLPGGRMAAVMTADGREPVTPGIEGAGEKQGKLFRTMTAYAGTYAVKGSALNIHVEVAGLPEWVGTDQEREFVLEGDRLTIRSRPTRSSSDGRNYVYVLVWKRLADPAR
jgi:hypothetical protein